MASQMLEISIVIPTRNEADCVRPLLARLAPALEALRAEVIFVDDSDDLTPAIIREVAFGCLFDVHLIYRPPGARDGGLGGAVLAGIRAAQAPWVLVMDGDLQHPPERVPELLEFARSGDADLVVATRDLSDNPANALSGLRRFLSRGLNGFLRLLFRGQLGGIMDPLSGWFVLRRSAVDVGRLSPRGFKVLLDILVRHPELRVENLPLEFRSRHAGASKAGLKEGIRFLRLLAGVWLLYNRRFLRFLLVGFTGLLVNSLLLAFLVEGTGLHYLLGAVLATQGSTLWNYLWTEGRVFPDGRYRRSGLQRLGGFFLMNNLLLLVRAPVLGILVDGLSINYLVANGISIVLFALARFWLSKGWIWANQSGDLMQEPVYYNIHGIVGISSTVRLPELTNFEVKAPPHCTDLQVITCSKSSLPADPEAVVYDEGFGDAGFWLRVRMGEKTVAYASPLLKRSPHVLYTNVVEPLLRWILVRKGYALIHGACISYRGAGLLISAATDTGKTTTILKSLRAYPFEFLADDMVILGEDGRLLSYPKPLTISLHTIKAVPTTDLSLPERIRLQIQSRIHSRYGRRIGIFFGHIRLPAATMNAYLQILVPPPKYSIERLVPGVRIANETKLAHLVVIERGPEHEELLPRERIVPIILRNIEDAYGFPPYPLIAGAISSWGDCDLPAYEKEQIRAAFEHLPAVHIHRDRFDWWRRLPAVFYGGLFGVPDPLSSRYPTIPREAIVKFGG